MGYEDNLIQFETKLGTMYYEISFDEVRLYDSDKSYINHDGVESYIKETDEELDDEEVGKRIIEHYKDIDTTDSSINILGEPIMFASSLEELVKQWNEYCRENDDDYEMSIEEFKDNIQYNVIGNTWFIIYYTEY